MKALLAVACVLSCLCVGEVVSTIWGSEFSGYDFTSHFMWNPKLNVCVEAPAGRVPWIIYVRNPDYGWNEHTHRANLALAVNAYRGSAEEETKMVQQLEFEITRALFRNETSKIHENDLALFIHALIARCKNPHDFYGINLVADLLHRVEEAIIKHGSVHPFLILALCNAGAALALRHLEAIKDFTRHDEHSRIDLDGRNAELKALALKAYACAIHTDRELDKFPVQMKRAAECLTRRQKDLHDGSFGNVYTTSLAVQALTACKIRECRDWDARRAREFLLKESVINVNLMKAYYIEMALNADNVTFVKDLCPGNWTTPPPPVVQHYMIYTIMKDLRPSYYFTVNMMIDDGTNFFEVMKRARDLSDRFSFNYTLNHERKPMVHMVIGIPNDAEENMFWRICRQTSAGITTHRDSPMKMMPQRNEHVTVWYRNTDCPNVVY